MNSGEISWMKHGLAEGYIWEYLFEITNVCVELFTHPIYYSPKTFYFFLNST